VACLSFYGSIIFRFHKIYRHFQAEIDTLTSIYLRQKLWNIQMIDSGVYRAYYVNMKRFPGLKLAFFDIDGTLLRRDFDGTLSVKSRAINYAAATVFGLQDADYTKILGKRLYGLTDKLILKTFLGKCGIAESQYYLRETELFAVIDDYFEKNNNASDVAGYYPLPGVLDFLNFLKADNVRLGLVTGNIRKHSIWKLEPSGLIDYFTTGGFGDDAESRSGIMQAGLARNGDIPIASVCHFGDSPADLEAARDCGIKAVAITENGGGTHSRDELKTVAYGLIVDAWDEIKQIGDYLNGEKER
jgi:phosphoglycolate phosphatase-like HAD superfamily hydrolase